VWFRWRRAFLREAASQPPGRGSAVFVRDKRAGAGPLVRACGGHDRECEQRPCRNRASSSSRGPSRPRPGQPGREGPEEGQVKSQPPRVLRGCRLSDGDAIRQVPGRAREQRHPLILTRGTARARPSGPKLLHTPAARSRGRDLGCLDAGDSFKASAESSQSRTSVHPAQLRVVIEHSSHVSSSSGLTRGSIP